MKPKKAIFLDRDGTVIINKHYLHRPEDIEYFSFAKKALALMQEKNYELFLVTNQSGVGRGLFPERDVHLVHARMQADLESWGLRPFRDIRYCPHSPADQCLCRKPAPKMIVDLLDKYQLDADQSYMVGDNITDAQAGEAAGVLSVLIKQRREGYTCFDHILDFARSL